MSCMILGIEINMMRKRAWNEKHKLAADSSHPRLHSIDQPSNMDETALKARQNLEQKLRSFSTSSKGKLKEERSRESQSWLHTTTLVHVWQGERGGGSKLEGRNSEEEICAVCLEAFQPGQHIMNLPCLHRYHSDCVIPWLTKHSHCPSCRAYVQV